MFNDKITAKIIEYYPNFNIKFKDQSFFMKCLGKIMFWNKKFMKGYVTTIGNTVYFPTESFLLSRPTSSFVTLLHEIVHIHDSNKLNRFLFSFLYLFPQILVLFLPILTLIFGPIAFLLLFFILPLPAYFRMKFELRAYLVSLYVLTKFKNDGYLINTEAHKESYIKDFKGRNYYYMWPFNNIIDKMEDGHNRIKNGKTPYEDPLFKIIDDILAQY